MEKLRSLNLEIAFTQRFQEALPEARSCGGKVTMAWQAAMPGGGTVNMAVTYPDGIEQKSFDDFRDSILKQLRLRNLQATSVRVTGLLYAARPTQ